ncbi:Putative flippase GtrA (transmembrane translocase of bactoprenol-linked glucose) [Bacillus sp. OV194]|nr:Putative flippase GtrA (transmembrane translocase of bactoprenol-linked glucose) [Bacillus sp. OV194]
MKHSFVRFLIVGVINTLVGLSVIYLLLHAANVSYWLATFLGNAAGACVSYVLNRMFTFKSTSPVAGSMIRFVIVILLCYFIAYYAGIRIADWAFSAILPLPKHFAKDAAVLIGTGLYTVLNYAGQKRFVFTESSSSGKAGTMTRE